LARYGQAFKNRAVARLLPPASAPPEAVAREIGVSADTLERWRSQALAKPAAERVWTAAARLEAVIVLFDSNEGHDELLIGRTSRLPHRAAETDPSARTPRSRPGAGGG
jgi:hypothetical protein